VDGVDALNNILLIGMTNRRDMLDEALLRPGRLEVQIEIGLPDEKGRLQILKIHTGKVRQGGGMGKGKGRSVGTKLLQSSLKLLPTRTLPQGNCAGAVLLVLYVPRPICWFEEPPSLPHTRSCPYCALLSLTARGAHVCRCPRTPSWRKT
jgi:hypothetical protein